MWVALLALLATAMPTMAQEGDYDPFQAYLDSLAEVYWQHHDKPQPGRDGMRRATVNIPEGLTEIDLSDPKYATFTSRVKTVVVNQPIKFVNGSITAKSNFTGGGCLIKVTQGVSVVFDETCTVDASLATSDKCLAAVGIYDCGYNTTVYQLGDITAPDNGTGIAVYIECASGTLYYTPDPYKINGSIYNPNGGKVSPIGPDVPCRFTKEQLLANLSDIAADLSTATAIYNNANELYAQLNGRLPDSSYTNIMAAMASLKSTLDNFAAQKNNLTTQVNQASDAQCDQLTQLNSQIESLAAQVSAFVESIAVDIARLDEQVKAYAASDLQGKLTASGNTITAMGNTLNAYYNTVGAMVGGSSGYYFEKILNSTFISQKAAVNGVISDNNNTLNTLINSYNALLNKSISTVQAAINFYASYEALVVQIESVQATIAATQQEVDTLAASYEALDVNFPGDEEVSVRPAGLTKELQVGYKSNRGYVLSAGGLLYFEQTTGANFRLFDMDGNYLVAKAGRATVTPTENEAEATVWTGKSLGNGSYTIYSKDAGRYLAFVAGTNPNAPVTVSTSAYAWNIIEPGVDPFQAIIYMLGEEEERKDIDPMPEDTLVIHVPDSPGPHYDPIIFPEVIYPIVLTGLPNPNCYFPIPRPQSGNPGVDYHPIYIPKGGHVIIENINFEDLVGGNHVIYVDGVLEITVNVNIIIRNWEWFIHVGPTGHVIWHTGGDDARPVKNQGTFDMVDGKIDKLDNSGTVNQTGGTIVNIINRNIYYFIGGLAHHSLNYGTFYHRGGQAITARNYEGGTYEMSGGSIYNTVVNYTDTVFVNRGTFRFTGGIIRGYGGRLIYHGPNAYMRIDGGTFDFTNIRYYFIEAHSDFYIRGNYDYGATVPILLAPKVVVRILYKWIYKFNIVFIDGGPTPRYPLFYGEGFTLTTNHYQYIDWPLPNHRWRWYLNVTNNTIEVRDEAVYDEDDLLAYFDWLVTYKDGEAASTEANPQVLDLGGRNIYLTRIVNVPVGVHVLIQNGYFRPTSTWTYDKVFVVPQTTSLRLEYVTINYNSESYYLVGGRLVQRYLFDIAGNVWFGPGTVISGYYNKLYKATDTYIPGAAIYMQPTARVVLDGCMFYDICLRISNTLNLYAKSALKGSFYLYPPSTCRYNGFRFIGPWQGYVLTRDDVNRFQIMPTGNLDEDKPVATEVDDDGYGALTDDFLMGDVNCDGVVTITDAACIQEFIMGHTPPIFRLAAADLNGDGNISISDAVAVVEQVLH